MGRVLVLNANDEPLGVTETRRAVILVLAHKADVVVAASQYRSPSISVPAPQVVRLRTYVHVPYRRVSRAPSLKALHARDGLNCAYCAKRPGVTIDHIVPRSRSGVHDWENTVAACARCNGKKAARTPHEAGMTLRVTPRVPSSTVWLAIVAQAVEPSWKPYVAGLGDLSLIEESESAAVFA